MRAVCIICAFTLAASSAAASTGVQWYWSRGTAQQALNRFFPDRLLRHQIGTDGIRHLAEVVFSSKCVGIDTPIFRESDPNTPLYSRLVCRVTIGSFDPYRVTRRPRYLVRVTGPSNLAHPDAPHHFTLQPLP